MTQEIAQSDYVAWKKDPVTKFIFNHLKEVRNNYLGLMVSKTYISDPNGLLKLNEYRGYVDAIEDFINMSPAEEDLVLTTEEEDR